MRRKTRETSWRLASSRACSGGTVPRALFPGPLPKLAAQRGASENVLTRPSLTHGLTGSVCPGTDGRAWDAVEGMGRLGWYEGRATQSSASEPEPPGGDWGPPDGAHVKVFL